MIGVSIDVQKEWEIITTAPLAFVLALSAVGAIMWGILVLMKSSEISGLREQLRLKDLNLAERDRLIRELRPVQTAYTVLSNETLKRNTVAFVEKLRAYYLRERGEEIKHQEREQMFVNEWPGASVEAGRQRLKLSWTSAYEAEFKSEAVLLRNEILARLPTVPPGGIWGPGSEYRLDLSNYGPIEYIFQIETIANHLESIAKLLPN
jgi:hypothetical protein